MKVNGNGLKAGMIIDHNGGIWRVIQTQSVKPGKGGAYNQVELRNVKTHTKLNERFRSNEAIEKLYVESKEFQYLYATKEFLSFMDLNSYEEIVLEEKMLGELKSFLQENMRVFIELINGDPISIKLPEHVSEVVTDTEAVIKGQTASSSFKPAILSNGVKVMVPTHIENGMKIIISTSNLTYVERAKN